MPVTDSEKRMPTENTTTTDQSTHGPEQLADRMGIHLLESTPDRVVGTMPVAGNRQPYGLLHGGASAVLAESLGSVAAALHAGPDQAAVGLELSCTHHRAVTEGDVTGVAVPLHRGSSTATYEITLTNEHGKRTCSARLTCLIRSKPPNQAGPESRSENGLS